MKIAHLITSNSRRSEILRFAMVGGLATAIQYGVYIVFVAAVGVPAVPSTIISYAISFVFNFFLSSIFTFHTSPTAKKGVGFTISHLINMGMQTGMVAIFKGITGPDLALLPAMAICIPLNYLMVRYALTSRRFQSAREKAQSEK